MQAKVWALSSKKRLVIISLHVENMAVLRRQKKTKFSCLSASSQKRKKGSSPHFQIRKVTFGCSQRSTNPLDSWSHQTPWSNLVARVERYHSPDALAITSTSLLYIWGLEMWIERVFQTSIRTQFTDLRYITQSIASWLDISRPNQESTPCFTWTPTRSWLPPVLFYAGTFVRPRSLASYYFL